MTKEWVKFSKGTDPVEVLKVIKTDNVWKIDREELYRVLDKNDIYLFLVDDKVKLMIYVCAMKVNGVFGFGEKARVEDEYLMDLKNELINFKDNHEYMEKLNNLIKLAPIYEKYQNDEDLTKEDLEFVYQVKREVIDFTGATLDKMDEIIEDRDAYEDLSNIFGVNPDNVALDLDEVDENTKVFVGNLTVLDDNIDELKSIEYVIGDVYLESKKLKKDIHIKSAWKIEEL